MSKKQFLTKVYNNNDKEPFEVIILKKNITKVHILKAGLLETVLFVPTVRTLFRQHYLGKIF